MPQTIREGTSSITATDWCLSKLLQPTYRSHYLMLSFIAEVCSSCPVSNAWPEKAASVLKWQKSRLRSRLKNDLLNPLLHIAIKGPKQESKELPLLIKEVVEEWLKEEDRRKLKRLPPISTNASTTSTPPISTSHSMTDQVTVDDDEDDLPLGAEDADHTMPSPQFPRCQNMLRSLITMHMWLLSSFKTVTPAIHTWEILTMNQTIFLINTIIINYINHELLHIHCCSLLK